MNDYVKLRVDATPCSTDITDLIAAFLAEAGYESFVADETGVDAYINKTQYSEEAAREALADFPLPSELKVTAEEIEGQDWNSEWEKHYFRPIVIGDYLIRSSFHTDLPEAKHEIIIDPRMAFGTGHHSTTSLMAGYLMDLDLTGLNVLDMGTGTGILAMMASMRGAANVTGIEIDPPAYENAIDNAALNNVDITLHLGDASLLADVKDIDLFMANINRNVITADLPAYVRTMRPGATMLLSGFYEHDIPVVMATAAPLGLTLEEQRTHQDWAAIRLRKG